MALIERVNALVYQTQAIGAVQKLARRLDNLVVVVGCHNSHNACHRPSHARTGMWATYSVDHRASHEVRIPVLLVLTEDPGPCALVDRVGFIKIPVQRGRKQRRDVGVVHDCYRPISIDLVRVYQLSPIRPVVGTDIHDPLTLDCNAKIRSELCHLPGHSSRSRTNCLELCHNSRTGLELAGKHHIGRNVELEQRAVITRSERTPDQPNTAPDWATSTVVRLGLGSPPRLPGELVVVVEDEAVIVVRGRHHRLGDIEHCLRSRDPVVIIVETNPAGGLVVAVANPQEGSQAIELALALEDQR